jgi:tetratricopeptide (TPR) repeat protein
LHQTLSAAQDRERELEKLADDVMSPDPDVWTAKDHLAHLAHWRRYAAQVLASVHSGGPAPSADDVDGVNAEVHAATRGQAAAEVKEAARASYSELAAAIDDCTETELMRPRPGRAGDAAWEVVPPNCHLHLGEHLGFWHEAQGDHLAADEAQIWTLKVHHAAFTEPKSVASAEYNLGCYYARNGRGAEALPYLKRSFELQPDLKEWARKDKDLDLIRQEPDVRAILV